MLEPSIDSLQEKINSKYILITIAARRAKDLQADAKSVIKHPKSLKAVGVALEEIYYDKLTVKEIPKD